MLIGMSRVDKNLGVDRKVICVWSYKASTKRQRGPDGSLSNLHWS